MKFSIWLEKESKILFGGFFKDGRVIVYINGKKYIYVTPAFYHDKWKKLANYSPFKVLNQIKTQIKNGESYLLD